MTPILHFLIGSMNLSLYRMAPLCLTLLLVPGCSSLPTMGQGFWKEPPTWLSPFRPEVSQGNVITAEQANRLAVGLTKEQVRALLGTPLLMDPFRDNRWDYVFDLRRTDGSRERRRFQVEFESGKLARWSGDPLPQTPVELLTQKGATK
ncbi:MAG: outer membrane protein assembly factor BamE [Burkholderiaceae bacterium]